MDVKRKSPIAGKASSFLPIHRQVEETPRNLQLGKRAGRRGTAVGELHWGISR